MEAVMLHLFVKIIGKIMSVILADYYVLVADSFNAIDSDNDVKLINVRLIPFALNPIPTIDQWCSLYNKLEAKQDWKWFYI